MNKRPLRRKLLKLYVPIFLLGVICLGAFGYTVTTRDGQTAEYNQGVASYTSLELTEALDHFDRSLAAYEAVKSGPAWRKFITPPDRVSAALAAHHKANILVRLKRFKEAVEAIQYASRLNPGDGYDFIRDFDNLSARDIDSLAEASLTSKNVYELLMKSEVIRRQVTGK
jgi:tetratricopeptide (TPR) repeat protein